MPQRGMLWTMKMECWANHRIPANPATLAQVLLLCDPMELVEALPYLMQFFEEKDGFLTCPELEDYRQYLDQRRRRQSEGGKIGADISNRKRPRTVAPEPIS